MNLVVSQDQISAFCERHHIRKLALFGSVLRGDFRPDSDIDVLVEFDADRPVTLFDMGAAQVELSELLGREVDLKTAGFLSPYFRQQVIDTAEVIYERV
jgi:predicted nucleotidyltransferase